MADLKLPEINPIEVDRHPEVFDRAGADFNRAMQSVAQIPAGLDKARVLVQSQDALLKRRGEINDRVYKVLDENPTVPPERIQELFGYDVPAELQAAIQKADGGPVPNYVVGPHLLSHVEKQATERAAKGIEGTGWQERFTQHAGLDAVGEQERFRGKMSGLEQNVLAQKMTDNYQIARDRKDPIGLEAAVAAQPNPVLRAKMEAQMPRDLRDMDLEALFETTGPPEAQLGQIQRAREVVLKGETPSSVEGLPPQKFAVPLSTAERNTWLHAADVKEKFIREEMYKAKKLKVFAPLLQMSLLQPAERRVVANSANFRLGLLDASLTEDDFKKAEGIIEAFESGKDIPADSALYGKLVRNGDAKLRAMTYQQVKDLEMSFPPTIHRELMDRWGKLDKGLSVEDWLDSRTSKFIDNALIPYKLNLKDAKSLQRHDQVWGDVAQEVIALRRAKGRDYFITAGEVSSMVLRRMQGTPSSNIGDTGYLDTDPGEALAAGEVLRTRGVPMTADKLREVALNARKDSDVIENAWKVWAPQNESITPAQRTLLYGMASDPRTVSEYRRRHEQYYAGRATAAPVFSPGILYGMLIAEKFANVDSHAAHPAVRAAMEAARERGSLENQYDSDAAAKAAADVGRSAPLPGTGAEARQPGESVEAWRTRNRQEREARLASEEAVAKASAARAAAEKAARAAAAQAAEDAKNAELQRGWDERQKRIREQAKPEWER
jgi:hypothetical protein